MKYNLQGTTNMRRIVTMLLTLVVSFVSIGATSQVTSKSLLRNTETCQASIANYAIAQKNEDLSDEEKIKAAIDTYFTIRYEGQKSLSELDFSFLVEDANSDWVKKEKDKREIELYNASLFNLGYQSYKFKLDYDSIEIKGNEAVVQLRESHEVVFNAIAPQISEMMNLKHTFLLHSKENDWQISNDKYQNELSQLMMSTSKEDIKKKIDQSYQLDVASQKTNSSNPAVITSYSYSGVEAAFYANSHISTSQCLACGYNTEYYETNPGTDCASFVSQALYAGGGKNAPSLNGMADASSSNSLYDWYYVYNFPGFPTSGSGSNPWLQVEAQKVFITNNTVNNKIGPYGYVTSNLCNTKVGDIVQLYGASGMLPTQWDHEGLIVSKGTNCASLSTTTVTAHTTDRYNYPLSSPEWSPLTKRYIIISGYNLDQTQVFTDVLPNFWASEEIERLYNSGITGGCYTSPLQYCPNNTVTRAQMAVFLLKGIHGYSYTPPPVGGTTGFNDVATGYWAAAWIKQLAAEGITGGCSFSPPLYCPEATVTHAQMAVFLLKSKHTSSYTPPNLGGSSGFYDVATNHWAAVWIKETGNEEISYGAHRCGFGNYYYCPENPVTRAEMAGMLLRAFNLP